MRPDTSDGRPGRTKEQLAIFDFKGRQIFQTRVTSAKEY